MFNCSQTGHYDFDQATAIKRHIWCKALQRDEYVEVVLNQMKSWCVEKLQNNDKPQEKQFNHDWDGFCFA